MNVRPPICISVSYLCPQRLGHTNACSYRVILHQSRDQFLKITTSFSAPFKNLYFFLSAIEQLSSSKFKTKNYKTYAVDLPRPVRENMNVLEGGKIFFFFQSKMKERGTGFSSLGRYTIYTLFQLIRE